MEWKVAGLNLTVDLEFFLRFSLQMLLSFLVVRICVVTCSRPELWLSGSYLAAARVSA
jgi:hypothetical protein